MKKLILMVATLAVLVAATAAVALAQEEEPAGYAGYITSISGESVFVEEDPQDPVLGGAGSSKGYFTVTGETGISGWWAATRWPRLRSRNCRLGSWYRPRTRDPSWNLTLRREEPAAS